MAKVMRSPLVTTGILGWGNRKSGCEAYGPGGRWEGGEHGDLLGDHLEREGMSEGAHLVVVALPRRCPVNETAVLARVQAVVDDLIADVAEAED